VFLPLYATTRDQINGNIQPLILNLQDYKLKKLPFLHSGLCKVFCYSDEKPINMMPLEKNRCFGKNLFFPKKGGVNLNNKQRSKISRFVWE
jgi:hypothetical protein